MDFSWMKIDDLLNTAFDKKQLGQMDMGDKVSLIQELARRLQDELDWIQEQGF